MPSEAAYSNDPRRGWTISPGTFGRISDGNSVWRDNSYYLGKLDRPMCMGQWRVEGFGAWGGDLHVAWPGAFSEATATFRQDGPKRESPGLSVEQI